MYFASDNKGTVKSLTGIQTVETIAKLTPFVMKVLLSLARSGLMGFELDEMVYVTNNAESQNSQNWLASEEFQLLGVFQPFLSDSRTEYLSPFDVFGRVTVDS
ncbi:hypothetical protein DINM_005144 [Dirofilaria immitis]|nr:hypothetical protein [Dirofilaria immitis]